MLSMLCNFAADNILNISLFFPEKKVEHFMQIVSLGDILHEMSNFFSK